MIKVNKLILLFLVGILVFSISLELTEAQLKKVKEKVQKNTKVKEKGKSEIIKGKVKDTKTKNLSGEIITIYPKNNPKYMSISLSNKNIDHYFLIDEDTKVKNKKGLGEIQIGDSVVITYEETTKITEEGKELRKRVARGIKFIKSKPEGGALRSR